MTLLNPCLRFTWVPASGASFSHAVAQRRLAFSDSGVCVAFRTIMLIESAAEPVSTLYPLTLRHTLVLITAVPSLIRIIHSYNAADCSRIKMQEGTDEGKSLNDYCQSKYRAASVLFI